MLLDWSAFFIVFLLAALILGGGWWLLRRESPPRWLFWLALGGALLRLALGVAWYFILPVSGYDTPAELRGYVMADAYDRDRNAWDLAASEKPLMRAFQGAYRKADQYGGMLFFSAAVYRFTGGEAHQPLLMVVLTAAFSSLAILFAWAFTRHLWGEAAARLAAWALALYPEAVLLGSSQMREAFIITLAVAASYGLLLFLREKGWRGILLASISILLCLPLSPPTAALLLVVLGLQALGMGGGLIVRISQRRGFWLLLVLLVVLVLAGLWVALLQFAPENVRNPLSVFTWWFRKSADWNRYLTERASGWVQKTFESTPEWTHPIMLVLYGVVQPFLPAALFDVTGAPIWRIIAVWRALGWTVILPFLLYAPIGALRRGKGLERALSLAAWLVILVASFRGGGDAWDNPRYRLAFAGLQIALAAWVWVEQRRQPDPWLRRLSVGVGLVLLWFAPWYLRRYLHLNWPIADLFATLGLGLASAVVYVVWDVVWGRKRAADTPVKHSGPE